MSFHKTVLPNGLTIATDHMPGGTAVAIRLIVGSGSRHDDIPGLAHFLEHVLACSLQPNGKETIDFIKPRAHKMEFLTSKESIEVWVHTVPRDAPAVLEALVRAFADPRWTEHIRERERLRIQEEYEKRLAVPGIKAVAEFWENTAAGHPFGHKIMGTEEAIAAIGEADLQRFVAENLVARRMALIVSGGVSHEEVLGGVHDIASTIRPGTPVPQQSAHHFGAEGLTYVPEQRDTQHTTIMFTHNDYDPARKVAMTALGNLYANALNAYLRRHALNYEGVNVGYIAFSDMGYLTMEIEAGPGKTPSIIGLAHDLLFEPELWLTEETFKRLKHNWDMGNAFDAQDTRVREKQIAEHFRTTRAILSYDTIDAAYDNLTYDEVCQAFLSLAENTDMHVISQGPNGDLPNPAIMNALAPAPEAEEPTLTPV